MKKVAILGSTGSIGTQTLEVVRENGDLQITALAAGGNVDLMETDPGISSPSGGSLDRGKSKRITGSGKGSSGKSRIRYGWTSGSGNRPGI